MALVILWTAVCLRLGDLPLIQPDEGRNAEVAREMEKSGAWLVPTYDGIDYLDKPAFYFKAVATSLACFGNSETAARLPSALFGIGSIILVYFFCRREFGFRCAAMAVIIVATIPLFLTNARTVIFDIALCFFTTAAIFAGYYGEKAQGNSSRIWYLIGAAAAGFAVLVKGPVGFLIPTLVLFVFNRVQGRPGMMKRFWSPLNLLVFFAVVLPWFIGLLRVHPDFAYYGLVEESFHRFTTKAFHRSEPFYFYAIIVMVMFLPWSLLLPEAVIGAWKSRKSLSDADRLCIVWAVVVVVFFSLSKSKLPGYILSTAVAGGILLARNFDKASVQPERKSARITRHATWIFGVLCIVSAVVMFFLSSHTGLLARPLRISATAAASFSSDTTAAMILFLLFALCSLLAVYKKSVQYCFICFALFPLALINVNYGMLDLVFNAKSAKILAQKIPVLPPKTEVACLRCFPSGLPFYLEHEVTLITTDANELTSNYILFRLKSGQAWPPNLVAFDGFDHWLASRDHPVYLIVRQQDRGRLEAMAASRQISIHQLTPEYFGALLPPL